MHMYILITCMCFRYLLIENFIPPEEKNKIMNRLHFDSEEDQWKLQPVIPERSGNKSNQRKGTSTIQSNLFM